MLKLKLQYFGHLMQRVDSFEKTLKMGKIEGGRRRVTPSAGTVQIPNLWTAREFPPVVFLVVFFF